MSQYKGFTSVSLSKPQRSMFDMTHERRLSTRMGRLTPIFCRETLPNDTWSVNSEVYVKLAPMLAPIFHRVNLFIHWFFVPQRLLWEDWEEFITGGRLGPNIDVQPVPPSVRISDLLDELSDYLDLGSNADHLGIRPIPDADTALWAEVNPIDIRPFAAFDHIWYDYYRDRNFVADTVLDMYPLPSGVIADSDPEWVAVESMFSKKQRAWQHDYFTSAQTSTQRGTEVLMPITAVIDEDDIAYKSVSSVYAADGTALADQTLLGNGVAPGSATQMFGGKTGTGANGETARVENIDQINLEGVTTSINEFRRAVALQQWLERNQLAGSRYNESIRAHFGRMTSDSRLQRAEYLGGGRAIIKVDEIMTTAYSEDSDTTVVPPGTPIGGGSAYSNVNGFRYNCEEHGFIMGILSVTPVSAYMQGIDRMFTARQSFLDYPWPTFANLGEEPVFDNEIWMDPATMTPQGDSGTSTYTEFGFQSRYAYWKDIQSSAHGDFRESLDFWHLTRKFAALPELGQAFVEFHDSDQDRIFNVTGVDTLWIYMNNVTKVVRSLPYFAAPAGLAPARV